MHLVSLGAGYAAIIFLCLALPFKISSEFIADLALKLVGEIFEMKHRLLKSSRNLKRVPLSLLAFSALAIAVNAAPQKSVKVPLPNSVLPIVSKSMPSVALNQGISSLERVNFSISLKPNDPAGLKAFADAVSNPKSDMYRQFITPVELGQRFGALQGDINAVKAFFLTNGMTITHVGASNLTVAGYGTRSQVEAMFGTTITNFQVATTDGMISYRSNTTPLNVPATLVNKIQSIDGVETYTRPQKRGSTLTPPLVQKLYSLSIPYNVGWTGAGRTVGISSWDGYRLSNAPLFISNYSLPFPSAGKGSNISVVTIDGGSGAGTPQGEGDLDFQMILGTSPLANIIIYDGSGGDLVTVLSTEFTANKADIITESYGWNVTGATAMSANNQHSMMTGAGITYMAASGDHGTSFGSFDYPDYDPEVLLVGGTVATVDGSGNRTAESTWGLASTWGGGGGWCTSTNSTNSGLNVRPSWQTGTGVPAVSTVNKRLVPDVGLHASGANGATTAAFVIYYNGSLAGFLGTSAASPTFAGGLANVEQRLYSTGGRGAKTNIGRLGRLQDRIYAQNGRSDVWFDITTGTSIGNLPSSGGGALNGTAANPTAGWDFATGWGAINFNTFYKTFFEAR